MIYEGTNHIQALDLVGRKLPMGNGRLLHSYAVELQGLLAECAAKPELAPFAMALGKQAGRLQQVTMELAGKAREDAEVLGAAANNYLNFFALIVLGHVWLRQLSHLAGQEDSDLKRAKFQTGRYFFEMVLPEATLYAKLAGVGKEPMIDFDVSLL